MATKDISKATTAELTDRAWALHDHNSMLATNPEYRLRVMNGDDPIYGDEDYDPDDPWFSYSAIEDALAIRGDRA